MVLASILTSKERLNIYIGKANVRFESIKLNVLELFGMIIIIIIIIIFRENIELVQ